MADARVARIEQGISDYYERNLDLHGLLCSELRAWQEIAERHVRSARQVATDHTGEEGMHICVACHAEWPYCNDRQAADAALDRLDALWGGESRG